MTSDFRAYLAFLGRILRTAVLFAGFSLPLLAVYGTALHRAGECLTIDQLARRFRGRPMIWQSGYYHCGNLRPHVAVRLQPEVVVLGSSRVMQFRSAMFSRMPPDRFYIAGTRGNFTLPLLTTMEQLAGSSHPPRLAIVGLDYWWFQTDLPPELQTRNRLPRCLSPQTYRRLRRTRHLLDEALTLALDHVQLVQKAWRDAAFYAACTATPIDPASGRCLVGVRARCTADGYRNDGSYRYGQRLGHFARDNVADGVAGRPWESSPYRGNHLNEAALDDFRKLIETCRKSRTKLIVFLPPLWPAAIEHFRRDPETAEFWQKLAPAIDSICRESHVPFHDCTDPSAWLAVKGNFFDWFHGSEKLYARMLLAMGRCPRTWQLLEPYLDRATLEHAIEQAGNSFLLYGD